MSTAKIAERAKKMLADRLKAGISDGTAESKLHEVFAVVDDSDSVINKLCAFFEGKNLTAYNPIHEVLMFLFIDMCILTNRIPKLSMSLQNYQKKSAREKEPPINRAVEYILGRITEQLSDTAASSAADAAESDDRFLAELLCVTDETNPMGDVFSSTSSQKLANSFAFVLFSNHRQSAPFGAARSATYLWAMEKFIALTRSFKLNRVLTTLHKSLTNLTKDVFDLNREDLAGPRLDALRGHAGAFIHCRLQVADAALEIGNWWVTRESVRQIHETIKVVEGAVVAFNKSSAANGEKVASPVDVAIGTRRIAVAAAVLLQSENWLFNGELQMRLVKFDPKNADTAIISALCVTKGVEEAADRSTRDEEDSALYRVGDMLGISALPSRVQLMEQAAALLGSADPSVAALFRMITAPAGVTDIAAAVDLLRAIRSVPSVGRRSGHAEAHPAARDLLLRALERTVLTEYMSTTLHSTGVLNFSVFAKVALLFPADNDVFQIAAERGASVDMVAGVARFNIANEHIRATLKRLSDVTAAILAPAPAASSSSSAANVPRRAPLAFTAADVLAEINRTADAHLLVNECLLKADKRRENIKAEEREREAEEKRKAAAEERAAFEARKRKERERLRVKVDEAVEVQHRRNILSLAEKRHKGVHFPPKIADDSRGFSDKATAILARFRNEELEAANALLQEAHYYEQFLRETELPKRRELATTQAAQNAADQAKRIANIKEQQRLTFERELQLKRSLSVYVDRAAAFMAAEMKRAQAHVKVSKRDEQEDLLAAERARLANM